MNEHVIMMNDCERESTKINFVINNFIFSEFSLNCLCFAAEKFLSCACMAGTNFSKIYILMRDHVCRQLIMI